MAFDSRAYVHDADKAALNALKAIPGFQQLVKGFMKIFSERQYRIVNLSSNIRISENQFPKYYEMLPPICEKL
ncbi:MAG: peptidase M48, partial [Lachnospiraceae bacterium]|nr:peptidase M48 [Lachnospiraceae bacterium]